MEERTPSRGQEPQRMPYCVFSLTLSGILRDEHDSTHICTYKLGLFPCLDSFLFVLLSSILRRATRAFFVKLDQSRALPVSFREATYCLAALFSLYPSSGLLGGPCMPLLPVGHFAFLEQLEGPATADDLYLISSSLNLCPNICISITYIQTFCLHECI